MVGCDVRSIRRWEQGKSMPDYENRHRLSNALCITLEDFNKLLQPVEEKVEEASESEVLTLENFNQMLQPAKVGEEKLVEGRDEKLVERDGVEEVVTESSHAISRGNEEVSADPAQPQRRALLKWGGTGLAAMVAGGGLFYWFVHSSSLSSLASPSLKASVTPSQVYTFTASQRAGVRDVEWSSIRDFIVYVDSNNIAQVITVFGNANSPSQINSSLANNLTPIAPDYSYSPTQLTTAVNCVAWSPDGKRLASSPDIASHMITIWDPTDKVSTHFDYAFGIPTSIAWSDDSRTIAICGDRGVVSTWNATSGQFLRLYTGHRGTVWRVAWSFNSLYLATAGDDGTVRIWNAETGENVLIYRGHHGSVFDVKWSPLSYTTLVSASQDKTARVWDSVTGETKLVYAQHSKSVQAAEWSSNGQYIASTGADTTIRIWDAVTGTDYAIYHDHTSTVWSLSWSPFGMDLASGSEDGTMQVRFVNV